MEKTLPWPPWPQACYTLYYVTYCPSESLTEPRNSSSYESKLPLSDLSHMSNHRSHFWKDRTPNQRPFWSNEAAFHAQGIPDPIRLWLLWQALETSSRRIRLVFTGKPGRMEKFQHPHQSSLLLVLWAPCLRCPIPTAILGFSALVATGMVLFDWNVRDCFCPWFG